MCLRVLEVASPHLPRDGFNQGSAGRERPPCLRRAAAAVRAQQPFRKDVSSCNHESLAAMYVDQTSWRPYHHFTMQTKAAATAEQSQSHTGCGATTTLFGTCAVCRVPCAVPSTTCSLILKKSILPPVQPASKFRTSRPMLGAAGCGSEIKGAHPHRKEPQVPTIPPSEPGGPNSLGRRATPSATEASRPEPSWLLTSTGGQGRQESAIDLSQHGVEHHAEVDHVRLLLNEVLPQFENCTPLYREVCFWVWTCR